MFAVRQSVSAEITFDYIQPYLWKIYWFRSNQTWWRVAETSTSLTCPFIRRGYCGQVGDRFIYEICLEKNWNGLTNGKRLMHDIQSVTTPFPCSCKHWFETFTCSYCKISYKTWKPSRDLPAHCWKNCKVLRVCQIHKFLKENCA